MYLAHRRIQLVVRAARSHDGRRPWSGQSFDKLLAAGRVGGLGESGVGPEHVGLSGVREDHRFAVQHRERGRVELGQILPAMDTCGSVEPSPGTTLRELLSQCGRSCIAIEGTDEDPGFVVHRQNHLVGSREDRLDAQEAENVITCDHSRRRRGCNWSEDGYFASARNEAGAAHPVAGDRSFDNHFERTLAPGRVERERRVDKDPGPVGCVDQVSDVAGLLEWLDHRAMLRLGYYARSLMAPRTSPPIAPTAPPPPRRRSRTGWRVLIGLLILANIVVFGAYFGLRFFTGRFAAEVGTITEVVPELSARPAAGAATNYLVIGSDSRDVLPEDFGEFGDFPGERADVIMIAQVLDGRARILSLPRDLKVELEGHGTQKINAAYAFGGAPLMVRTVRDVTGLDIHHYAEIDFFGFASLVDELGGVTINFPNAARDLKSGLDVPAGDVELSGDMALAYARSRQYEELRNGSWVAVDGSDLGRIQRQQRLIFAMLSAAKRPSIVFDAPGIISTLGDHMSTDATLDGATLADLALDARSFDAASIDAMTLPTQFQSIGGVSYLVPDEPAAGEMIALFAREAVPEEPGENAALAPTDIRLRVLNGNGSAGQATTWSDRLAQAGFEIVSVGDAGAFTHPTTLVQVADGQTAIGQVVVSQLGFGSIEAAAVPDGVDAVVVVGEDALSR